MDLKANPVSFQGKKEILYGLKNAADSIHSYSLYRQSRLMQMCENKNLDKYESYARAYLDMVTIDEAFPESVKKFNKNDLKNIRTLLKPYEVQYSKINPMMYFKEFIESVMYKNGKKSADVADAIKTLIEKLS